MLKRSTIHYHRDRRAFMAAFGIDDAFLAELAHRLANRHRGGERDVEAAAAAWHRDQQCRSAAWRTWSGTPADSRPNSRMSPWPKANSV